MSCFRWII